MKYTKEVSNKIFDQTAREVGGKGNHRPKETRRDKVSYETQSRTA